ncbi:hypothetical protein D3C84_1218570 [compost metagenome]
MSHSYQAKLTAGQKLRLDLQTFLEESLNELLNPPSFLLPLETFPFLESEERNMQDPAQRLLILHAKTQATSSKNTTYS